MFVADLLSRSFVNNTDDNFDELANDVIHCVGLAKNVSVSDERKREIRLILKEDPSLSKLIYYIKKGWPKERHNVHDLVKCCNNQRSLITVDDDLLFLNDRIIIPVNMRKYVLNKLHESHFGIEKTKARARQVVYWPNISKDIENLILKRSICEWYRNNNIKEPMLSHDIPELPFCKVAVDILEFDGLSYLVLIDYLSKWIELKRLKNKSAYEIIKLLTDIFSTHGVPKEVVADNVPFNSFACNMFAKEWNFKFNFSSPLYSQSNGLAERAVQVCKKMLNKCRDEKRDVNIALMEYSNMPLSTLNVSPAQILFSRMLRTKIPVSEKLLIPKIEPDIKNRLVARQGKNKLYYDKSAKVRKPFSPGENFLLRNVINKTWEPGKIIKKHVAPRSYVVETRNGSQLRRNSSFIRKSLVEHDPIPSPIIRPTHSGSSSGHCHSPVEKQGPTSPKHNSNIPALPKTPNRLNITPSRNFTHNNEGDGLERVSKYGRVIRPKKMFDM